jgi:hypothetical protein
MQQGSALFPAPRKLTLRSREQSPPALPARFVVTPSTTTRLLYMHGSLGLCTSGDRQAGLQATLPVRSTAPSDPSLLEKPLKTCQAQRCLLLTPATFLLWCTWSRQASYSQATLLPLTLHSFHTVAQRACQCACDSPRSCHLFSSLGSVSLSSCSSSLSSGGGATLSGSGITARQEMFSD